MRWLMISQDYPPQPGGVARYARAIAVRLARRSDRFVLVAPRNRHARDEEPFEVVGVPGGSDLTGALAPLLARERFDAAFCTSWGGAVGCAALRRSGRLPRLVVAAHGRELLLSPWPAPLDRAYDAIRRATLASADGLVPVSRYTAGLLASLGVPSGRIIVAHNGVDASRFEAGEPSRLRRTHGLAGRRVLLTVGRLVPRKGIDTTLAALPRILEAAPDITYVVVGEGPDRDRLDRLAQSFGDRVRFVGAAPEAELPSWYRLADLFVMPARSEPPDVEGFGLVFLEAGAAATPVIGARAGGVVDAIDHERTGLLVPPADPEALAAAALRILGDPHLAAELGAAGRARARASSWDAVAAAVAEALEGV